MKSKIILWSIVILALIAFGPIITIWGLNTLFPVLAIPYTLETWAAVIIVQLAIRSNINIKK